MKALAHLFGILLLAMSAAAKAGVVLTIALPAGPVTQGDTFTASVNVVDSADLFGYQLDLLFNPSLVSVQNIAEGTLLGSGGSTSFIGGDIDNQLGTVAWSANTLLGAVPGVNGSGSLLLLQIKALAPGLAAFSLANMLLVDSNLDPIDITIDTGTVQITAREPFPVNEPNALMLILPLAIFLVRQERRLARKVASASSKQLTN